MVVKMPVESEKNFDAAVVGVPMAISSKPKTKKYVIVGVVSVTIAVLILIGLLVGIYLFTDTFNKIYLKSMQTNENTNQETTVDVTSNIIEYNVQENGVNVIYVDDYNMFLSVVKLTIGGDVMCFVTSLNVTQKPDFTKIVNNMDKTVNSTVEYAFVRSKIPIPDISFMNRKSRNMCKGITTYWAYLACQSGKASQKQKRGLCAVVCKWICRWISGRNECGNYCWIADVFCGLLSGSTGGSTGGPTGGSGTGPTGGSGTGPTGG